MRAAAPLHTPSIQPLNSLLLVLAILLSPVVALILLLLCARVLLPPLRRYHRRRHPSPSARSHRDNSLRGRALVITLSPGNHSPRAHAHAQSLRQHFPTYLLSHAPLSTPPAIHVQQIHSLSRTAPLLVRQIFHVFAIVKAISSHLLHHVAVIVINVPPALPILPMLPLLRLLYPAAVVVVDWHNLAYTLMSERSPFITHIAHRLERAFVTHAQVHWTVSKALSAHLNQWRIHALVVYDRPRHTFRQPRHGLGLPPSLHRRIERAATCIGRTLQAPVPVVVTATSWTPDEDFHVLLQALLVLDAAALPLRVVITGRGPMRVAYEARLRAARLRHIAVWCVWLAADDYPRLLAAADLGLSLHVSSSGLDLPMKVVDMFACALPVVALRFACVGELVRHARTGILVDDADQLAHAIRRLLFDQPHELARMRKHVANAFPPEMEWEPYWERTALPSISAALPSKSLSADEHDSNSHR